MSKIPKLRFKEFSGEWERKTLGELSHKIMVGIASSTTHAYRKSGIIMFRNQNIKTNHLDDTDILYLDEEYEKTHRNKRLMPGDLLTARTGYPGTTCVVPSKYVNTQTFTTLITRPNKNLAMSEYLSQYINSDRGTKFFKSVEIGGGQKNVNAETMKSLPIFVPNLKEQEKIASFFSLIDNKISLQSEKVEALKDYKKGVMQKIFSRELRFKDDEGRDYPDWEEKKLGEVCNITMGQSPSSSCYNEDEIGLPLIQGNADVKNRKTAPRIYTSEITKTCDIGDIIMSVRAPVGVISKSIHNACIGRGVCSIKPKQNKEYIYQFLLNSEKKWSKISQGSTFESVSSSDIKGMNILMPQLEEQKKIANFLYNIDYKIDKEQEKLDSLNEYKKGLLQQMFV